MRRVQVYFYIVRASDHEAAVPQAREVGKDARGRPIQQIGVEKVEDFITLMREVRQPLILYPARNEQSAYVNPAADYLPPGDLPSITIYDDYVE